MIVVVQGQSAAGKTTWCTAHGADSVIAETDPIELPTLKSEHELARSGAMSTAAVGRRPFGSRTSAGWPCVTRIR